MIFTGRKIDGVLQDVGGFGAQHLLPFVVGEIGHGVGGLLPGIPDYCGAGILFGDADGAMECGVEQFEGILGVDVGAVGL